MAILIFLVFLVIAFFEVSNLNLVAFIAKKIKDSFLDVPKRFQMNFNKHNPTEVTIAKSKQEKSKQRIEIKEDIDVSKIANIEKGGLL